MPKRNSMEEKREPEPKVKCPKCGSINTQFFGIMHQCKSCDYTYDYLYHALQDRRR